jgi:hypothetical protein
MMENVLLYGIFWVFEAVVSCYKLLVVGVGLMGCYLVCRKALAVHIRILVNKV